MESRKSKISEEEKEQRLKNKEKEKEINEEELIKILKDRGEQKRLI